MPELRLLTFNAGLLRAAGGLLQPAPFVNQRREALPHALGTTGADVIVLQEVYDGRSRAAIAAAFPHVSLPARTTRRLALQNGLMVASRQPLRTAFHRFRAGTLEERLFDRKGFSVTELQSLTIVNFHTTAGGLRRHPEDPLVERIRGRQIDEMLRVLDSAAACVLAGDLNAGPGVSETNYRQLERAGFVDAWALHHPGSDGATWDPANPLNAGGPHQTSPPQRCDHIFLRGPVTALSSEIVLTEPIVDTGGRRVTLSDHYGLTAMLAFG
ncbi:MAG TPA: endonuclease/exonuclease/phosphatase family protein [Thermoanaerobaculia bacterium]|jgi:endonuclease/exonuclease/phosphatase family metal-dependent hydrolase|nr:endonuclease/exonuclease/phosphatase family protein [Thermoanaerobaculia bacterium]